MPALTDDDNVLEGTEYIVVIAANGDRFKVCWKMELNKLG